MKVLVSPATVDEARLLVDAGVDILDVKNPAEGSLGAQTPGVIREVTGIASACGIAVSAALGDLDAKPGTAALAAFGLAQLGVHYIKAGLHGTRTREQAASLLEAITEAIRMVDPSIAIVASGYADYRRFDGLTPTDLLAAAARSGCAIVMLDTSIKDGRTVSDAMSQDELSDFVAAARQSHRQVALAGSIGFDHLELMAKLRPDIIGVRSAVCKNGDRRSPIDRQRAEHFLSEARAIVC